LQERLLPNNSLKRTKTPAGLPPLSFSRYDLEPQKHDPPCAATYLYLGIYQKNYGKQVKYLRWDIPEF